MVAAAVPAEMMAKRSHPPLTAAPEPECPPESAVPLNGPALEPPARERRQRPRRTPVHLARRRFATMAKLQSAVTRGHTPKPLPVVPLARW